MTDRFDRSYARAQRAWDAMEAPCEDTCPECQGGGRVECATCWGSGEGVGGVLCDYCNGRGSVPCTCDYGGAEAMADYYQHGADEDDIAF